MERVVRIQTMGSRQRERWVSGYRWAAAQPNWVLRVALLTFLLVVFLPLALLVGLAMIAGLIVLGGMALVLAAYAKLKSLLPSRHGRSSNVRVIRRD